MDKTLLFKIILVGDTNVGKSSLINTFHTNESKPTSKIEKSIGVDYVKGFFNQVTKRFEIKKENFSKFVRLEIWDTAGNDKMRTMSTSYYKGISDNN